jgi:hypothetical protein
MTVKKPAKKSGKPADKPVKKSEPLFSPKEWAILEKCLNMVPGTPDWFKLDRGDQAWLTARLKDSNFVDRLRHSSYPDLAHTRLDHLKKIQRLNAREQALEDLVTTKKPRRQKRSLVPCPECKSPNTRATSTTKTKQYRKCRKCGHRFNVARKKK